MRIVDVFSLDDLQGLLGMLNETPRGPALAAVTRDGTPFLAWFADDDLQIAVSTTGDDMGLALHWTEDGVEDGRCSVAHYIDDATLEASVVPWLRWPVAVVLSSKDALAWGRVSVDQNL